MRTQEIATAGSLLRLLDEKALAWLAMLEANPGEAFYLTSHRDAIDYGGRTWQPWPMRFEVLSDDGEGNLPTTTLTLANVGRVAMPYLEARGWDEGDVVLQLVYAPAPAALPINLRVRFQILSASANWEAVTLRLGQPNFFNRQYPAERFIRDAGYPGIRRNLS